MSSGRLPPFSHALPCHVYPRRAPTHLHDLDEARAALAEMLRLAPEVSVSSLRLLHASAGSDYTERYLDGLRKTGLKVE